MSKQPEALRLADELAQRWSENMVCPELEAAAELRRLSQSEREGWRYAKELESANAELLEALKGLDEAYCRAGSPLTRDERTEDRKRLISAREAIAKATGEQQ